MATEGHDRVFDILFNKDEVTWQSMIYDLVREDEMDPWDIDVSRLTDRYVQMLKELKNMDFSISGKVVLAAAILLKLKSTKLVGEDINYLDSLFAQKDEIEDEGFDDIDEKYYSMNEEDTPPLIPRTPQPRKRKVSVYDLIEALQKAMEVKTRRVARHLPKDLAIEVPKRKFDISQVIREVYGTIREYFVKTKHEKMTFSQLLPQNPSREDKVYTFIPLLHLTNQRKLNLEQEKAFSEIHIQLLKR